MKTKHLLFAAALPLAFAACQNEEFESANSPELSNDQRPLVEVKLGFQKEGADTRVSYDGADYGWQATDKIGAFLMDEIKSTNRPFGSTADAWAKETWLEHYELVDYIHTDYPFSWDATKREWVAPSKLQEGNYFFAAPYETYEGQRQLIHKIDGQVQTGGTVADMNKAISENQYFIGYAQVKAGAGNRETLKDVVMTPALAPVKVTLRNIGTKAMNIEKIVIEGTQVATMLTVNPTDAAYGGTDADGKIQVVDADKYNLGDNTQSLGNTNVFNYANLIDAVDDVHDAGGISVYNIASGAEDYKKGDALRQIVKASYSSGGPAAYEKQAVLSFAEPVKVAPNGGEIHFAVMVNAIPQVTADQLSMNIISTQGRITGINLTEINEKETDGNNLKPNTVITNNEIKSLKPFTKNELIIQFDNNSMVALQEMNILDETDLLAFINWNAENTRLSTATLLKDVKFTKEMYDAIKAATYKGQLAIKGTAGKLLVDNDVPTDVLNVLHKTSDATIVLNGEREMTEDIANGLAEAQLTIENQGVMNINGKVTANVVLNNYGTINVAEAGQLLGQSDNNKVYNYGMIVNKGQISNVNNSVSPDKEFKGWIKTSGVRNNIATNAAEATIQLTNINDPLVVPAGGIIYFETATGVKASELKEVKGRRSVGVTKLNVTGGTIDFDNTDNATVTELTINGEVSVEGWNGATPRVSTYHKFTGVTEAEISGNVTFANAGIEGSSDVLVNKNASLTFDKAAKFNDVTFVKGATATVKEGCTVEMTNITWNNNKIKNFGNFYYITTGADNVTVEAGNPIVQKPTTPSVPEQDVTISSGGGSYEYATLKALAKAVEDGDVVIKDKITLSENITLSEDEASDEYFGYLKTLAADKEVVLSADLRGLTTPMGMEFDKLTMGADATVEGTTPTQAVILTVAELDFSTQNLTITNGQIKMSNPYQIGATCPEIKNGATLSGKIVAQKLGATVGELVEWDNANVQWVELKVLP